jgi:hypothetical protein
MRLWVQFPVPENKILTIITKKKIPKTGEYKKNPEMISL